MREDENQFGGNSGSEQINAVLRDVRGMKMCPVARVPDYPTRRVFWFCCLPLAGIPLFYPISVGIVEGLVDTLSSGEALLLLLLALVLIACGALVSGLVAMLIKVCHGECIEDDGYGSRVRHDYNNALRLLKYSDKVLKQAAIQLRQAIERRSHTQTFMFAYMIGVGTVIGALLAGFEIPKTSSLYGDFLRYGALSTPVVFAVQIYSNMKLPKLRYHLTIVEMAQNIERAAPDVKAQPRDVGHSLGLLSGALRHVFRRLS